MTCGSVSVSFSTICFTDERDVRSIVYELQELHRKDEAHSLILYKKIYSGSIELNLSQKL
jgi:hypothetical protein